MTRGGVITAITYQKRDKTRASVFIDGEFAFGVFVDTAERYRLRKGIELSVDLINEIELYDESRRARRIAERYINRRRRSEFEVRKKLRDEEIDESMIDDIIDSLKESRLIDDEAFAAAYIHDKLIAKPHSLKRLTGDLRKLGIDQYIINTTITDAGLNGSEEERAKQSAEKKWQQIVRRESDPKKQKQKLIAFLSSRGFSYDTIKRTVSVLLEDTESNEEDD